MLILSKSVRECTDSGWSGSAPTCLGKSLGNYV